MKNILLRSSLVIAVTGGAVICSARNVEAAGASLLCEGIDNGVICDAFPIGAGYDYAWTSSGGLALVAAPPNSQSRQLVCVGGSSGGTVNVVVTYPNGTQYSVGRNVDCGY